MTCRILCTGDIHIGRRASKAHGAYRSADAWKTIVDLAISERVDLLAISGDIADKSNAQYEALGPLQGGLRRLDEAGIETYVVAGNHDHNVLPRLARLVGGDRFHLVGAQGAWQSLTFMRDGKPALQIVGWSFPREHVDQNPMRDFVKAPSNGVPTIALLHADVGNVRSTYGPVSTSDFWSQEVDVWILGHIHNSAVYSGPGNRFAMYPGSPYAMDPGEYGKHGVWIIEIEPDGRATHRQITISPVLYASADVDLSGVNDEEGFLATVSDKLRAIGESAIQESDSGYLKEIPCRLTLTGATSAHQSVREWAERAKDDLELTFGSVDVRIDEIATAVRPVVDLPSLATGNDPVAETARVIMALSKDELESPYLELVERALRGLQEVQRNAGYISLQNGDSEDAASPVNEQDARQLLTDQSWQLLSALYAQKEAE